MAVALLAEGVDRNVSEDITIAQGVGVALLAEGVDRNLVVEGFHAHSDVALLAEGVDRNPIDYVPDLAAARRPPRGGRG